jgi:hypothetical protein
MPGERMRLNGLMLLGALVAAVLVGFTVLLLANARHNAPMQTDVVSSASSSLAAGASGAH